MNSRTEIIGPTGKEKLEAFEAIWGLLNMEPGDAPADAVRKVADLKLAQIDLRTKLTSTQEMFLELEFIRDTQQACGWKVGHPPPPCVLELRKRTPVEERVKYAANIALRQMLQAEVVELAAQVNQGMPIDATEGDVPQDGKRYRVWSRSSVVQWEAGPNRFIDADLRHETDAEFAAWNNDGWKLEPAEDEP